MRTTLRTFRILKVLRVLRALIVLSVLRVLKTFRRVLRVIRIMCQYLNDPQGLHGPERPYGAECGQDTNTFRASIVLSFL